MRTKRQEIALFQGLKPSEVAKALGCSTDHVLTLIKAKQLPAIDISTGKRSEYRIEKQAFEAFIEERRIA